MSSWTRWGVGGVPAGTQRPDTIEIKVGWEDGCVCKGGPVLGAVPISAKSAPSSERSIPPGFVRRTVDPTEIDAIREYGGYLQVGRGRGSGRVLL